mmetsp:Transcript_28979/g.63932  ORF Transcript_28979/g.63932 Transcript_28979/m.63932 type:complete len:202 (+) Transcript_28979:738-1343(+)
MVHVCNGGVCLHQCVGPSRQQPAAVVGQQGQGAGEWHQGQQVLLGQRQEVRQAQQPRAQQGPQDARLGVANALCHQVFAALGHSLSMWPKCIVVEAVVRAAACYVHVHHPHQAAQVPLGVRWGLEGVLRVLPRDRAAGGLAAQQICQHAQIQRGAATGIQAHEGACRVLGLGAQLTVGGPETSQCQGWSQPLDSWQVVIAT